MVSRLAVVMVLSVASLAAGRLIVHSTTPHNEKKGLGAGVIKDVNTHMHVDAHIMDLTNEVQEIPEQSLPVHKSTHRRPVADLEEDEENDPTRLVQELPEQTLADPVPSQANPSLEQDSGDSRVPNELGERDLERADADDDVDAAANDLDADDGVDAAANDLDDDDDENDADGKLEEESRDMFDQADEEESNLEDPPIFQHISQDIFTPENQPETPAGDRLPRAQHATHHKRTAAPVASNRPNTFTEGPTHTETSTGLRSENPKTGEHFASSSHFSTPNQFIGDYMPPNYQNPLLMNHNPPIDDTPRSDPKLVYEKDDDSNVMEFDSGDFHFDVRHNTARNFLDASKVQIGTSELGAHKDSAHVARFRIRFTSPFTQRPIVLVQTVPQSMSSIGYQGVHPDVFAASVSEIRLDSFVVNVIRVDSLPNNGWGQVLYLDWIAMEYNSDYPHAEQALYTAPDEYYGGGWLPNEPRYDMEEQVGGERAHVERAMTDNVRAEAEMKWDATPAENVEEEDQ